MSFCGGNLGFLINRINLKDYNTLSLQLSFSSNTLTSQNTFLNDAIVENNDIQNKTIDKLHEYLKVFWDIFILFKRFYCKNN